MSSENDERPFALHVEAAFRITGRPGTVIMGVIQQGTLHIGDHLELIQPDNSDTTVPLQFQCTGIDAAPRATGRDPALGPYIAIMGIGIDPEQVRAGAKLQAARHA